MQTDKFEISVGNLGVKTTDYRGHTIDEVAEMATDRLISISETAPDTIKAQAHVFKDATRKVIIHYMDEAIKNHICTMCNQLEQQGHKDLANIIRRL